MSNSAQSAGATGAASKGLVQLTESAAREILSLRGQQPEHAGKPLRLYVEGGGCSGLQYGMVFDEQRPNDKLSTQFGVDVVMDEVSVEHLQGSVVDFSDALTGGGFKISNPNAKSSCGCGKSFEA